jgi:Asp/Glu/hydantoin racemase
LVYGNRTNYGQAIGILMLETFFPRIPGDIGNATTFRYPVLYKTIKGANADTVVKRPDPNIVGLFAEGAQELVEQGARAIVTSCGFTAIFHRELAAAVDVPVFSSSLLQAKLIYSMLKPGQKVGIITANKPLLTQRHFEGVGIQDIPKVVAGMEETDFGKMFFNGNHRIDVEKATEDMCRVAKKLVDENPDVGAILLECTNMPPFSKAVQDTTGLPVFDIITLTDYVYSAVVQRQFTGYL